MRYGYDMNTVRTPINAWSVDVFHSTALMAAALGRPAPEVASYQRHADNLTQAMNARLRRSDGVYIDGLHADGSKSTHASQQANDEALRFGVVPAAQAGTVGAYVAQLEHAVRTGDGRVDDAGT